MAIYAIHEQEPKFIFIMNFKVMYSSMTKILPVSFPEIKFHGIRTASKFNFYDFQIFSVVRNPISRAISAYFGKCQYSIKKHFNNEKAQLQYSQHQLLESLKRVRGIDYNIARPAIFYSYKSEPKERGLLDDNYELLMDISFEEYIKCLRILFQSKDVDGHFQRQFDAFLVPNQNPFYNRSKLLNNTEIIKIENLSNDWKMIGERLNKDIEIERYNRTDHIRPSIESYYSDDTYKSIVDLYKLDFEKFNYPFPPMQ